jgi:hypothetical protein
MKKYYFTSSSGLIEFQLTKQQVLKGDHQGDCKSDIIELMKLPSIKKIMSNLDKDLLKRELKELGAWDEIELCNHDDNLKRILWIACCDIKEENLF